MYLIKFMELEVFLKVKFKLKPEGGIGVEQVMGSGMGSAGGSGAVCVKWGGSQEKKEWKRIFW